MELQPKACDVLVGCSETFTATAQSEPTSCTLMSPAVTREFGTEARDDMDAAEEVTQDLVLKKTTSIKPYQAVDDSGERETLVSEQQLSHLAVSLFLTWNYPSRPVIGWGITQDILMQFYKKIVYRVPLPTLQDVPF
jgi:hypothetical protein